MWDLGLLLAQLSQLLASFMLSGGVGGGGRGSVWQLWLESLRLRGVQGFAV